MHGGHDDRSGITVVAAGLIVQRPVRFDVFQLHAFRVGQADHGADLVNTVLPDLLLVAL